MSAEIFGFRGGPTYRGASPVEQFDAAMAAPMSLTSTFFDQAKGGILESFGLGTAIRSAQLPEAAPTEPGLALTRPDGTVLTLPDTPNMRRRQVVQGVQVPRETPQQFEQRRTDAGALTEDAYKSSPYFRSSIPWDAGMTQDRAAALAMMDDAKKVREFYAEKRPITAFIGNLAGQALDPINYIPVTGPAVRAAAAARFGRIGGAAVASALDAAGNTALAALATQDIRGTFGDDVSWQSTVSQIATAALIGGAFGTIGGAIGARSDARTRRMAEDRLATLKATQEARIALNEGIDALAKGEDVALTPNTTERVTRMAGEVSDLSKAYDTVRTDPTGSVNDPLVRITPSDIEGMVVARGAFEGKNEIEFSDRGYGLVKIIWGHGEASKTAPEFQVSKEDVLALPEVVRQFNPSKVSPDGSRREWRVENNGRTVVYADKVMMGNRHLVTTYIQEPGRKGFDAPLSERKTASQSVPSGVSTTLEDTAGGLSASLPGVTKRPGNNIAQSLATDNSKAAPEPRPVGVDDAEKAIGKADDFKALAAQYRVDPQTGSFTEESDIAQLAVEGRLTEDDAVVLADAQATFEDGAAYGEALKSVASCLI